MIVVADSGPIHYLVLIGAVDVLSPLYAQAIVPHTVAQELQQAAAPAEIRAWIARPPAWFAVRPDPLPDSTLVMLDPGERAAIGLALSIHSRRLLIDDWDGRAEAVRRGILVTGTLGVLALAHQRGLLDFESVLARLSHTNFYLSTALVDLVRQRLKTGI